MTDKPRPDIDEDEIPAPMSVDGFMPQLTDEAWGKLTRRIKASKVDAPRERPVRRLKKRPETE